MSRAIVSFRVSCAQPLAPLGAIVLVGLMLLVAVRGPVAAAELQSPDGNVVVGFTVADAVALEGRIFYNVSYRGKPVLLDSPLGLELKDAPPLDRGFRVVKLTPRTHDSTWKPVYGERSEIRDRYNELAVDLEDSQSPPRRLRITFRAYNEGAALCYTVPRQEVLKEFTITAESTAFRFTGNHLAYAVYSAQGVYSAVPLDKIKPNCERPLTVAIEGGQYAAVAEARLVDYARMRLGPAKDQPHMLVAVLGSPVAATAPLTTPWRVVMLGDTPGQLLQRNDLILNLNDPCALADTSWIKPGKVIREVTLSTSGGKACVDFAVAHGLQYVEYDAGWYGHEYDDQADARKVDVDVKRTGGRKDLDLHEVIRYADQKGIGVIVYVNRRALERQIDEILPLYRQWGVKGVKYGFLQVGSQRWTAWLHEAVRKAAAQKLMVDIHDEYRPTGYSRTYPNLMTVEGIGGNETMPTPEHNCTLPFTRFLCGAADATICWYDTRIKTSHAHQLALAVVFYSPWQFLYWYDRPAQYRGEPELEFFRQVPTVWDDTRVVGGEIGQYATIARRSGREWYVGTINAVKRRALEIPLWFLDSDRQYVAEVHADRDPAGADSKEVKTERIVVNSRTVLKADLAANGGQAIRLVPKNQ